ncbi:MAG: 3-phosphoshikimate 1-carboxyvinyltransferase [Planctomycetota bacterium]
MRDPLPILPAAGPLTGSVRPPGSKSLTNRALPIAALADGTSTLTGVLDSDDTRYMAEALRDLGFVVEHVVDEHTMRIEGRAGRVRADSAELFLGNSGTSIRFLTALVAAGNGRYHLDGNARMRQRPIGDLVDAIRRLGIEAACTAGNDCPPVEITTAGLPGGTVTVGGTISSQYLSGLLMAAPAAQGEVTIEVTGPLVSRPYVDMTLAIMRDFGGLVEETADGDTTRFRVTPRPYAATDYAIEPDASAASYFFAAAAITGGEITVEGLSIDSLQGDVAFVDALEAMGADVEYARDSIAVTGPPAGGLHGIDIDMGDFSDTAQTLAAVAVFADGPTTIRGVAHNRVKETDRVAAVVTELRKLGQEVEEFDDGMTITPRPVTPAVVDTYDDHRMAMSFALIGLGADGVEIRDPGCTAKTYPAYWDDLAALCAGQGGPVL